jgi:DNA gyrase subunit A
VADETTPNPGDLPPSDIKPVSITDELSRSYLDYAMSVIVSRALPDVRDGLKPVHRRILYSMHEQGYEWNKPYRKSARIVGDVIGKYHPHGDQSVYDALVRMAQDFSMRVQLVDGQGNFGSVDGDPPAAMRYTEVRLQKIAAALVDDLDKKTVDFQDNYDGSEREPVVLPARYPNLLVNGAGGIAVGMATNIPPHNLGEVIDACIALIEKPDITLDELAEIVPGPDFPTGGIILGKNGIRQAYHLGRGSIMVRGRVAIETDKRERESIIITEIPYQVNKASMIERIAELVRDKRIDGIGDIRDESSRDGMRVVIELRREAVSEIVLNQLYRFTALQSSFPANIVALSGGRPATMNLHDLVSAFVAFREDTIGRRTKFLLNKARDRAHILVGLAIAVANIDEVIKVIRGSKDAAAAREELMSREWPAKDVKALVELIDDPRHKVTAAGTYILSEEQARAILDLRLQRLTALGRDEIEAELDGLGKEIAEYLDILRSRARIQSIIKTELSDIKKEFATPRKTEISGEEVGEIDEEALITPEDMVVTVSHAGYVKRVPLSTYRAQRRGGKGRAGMQTREEDFVSRLFVASTHDEVLFFSSRGRAYTLKVWKLPLAAPQARGKAFVNLLPIQPDETIT